MFIRIPQLWLHRDTTNGCTPTPDFTGHEHQVQEVRRWGAARLNLLSSAVVVLFTMLLVTTSVAAQTPAIQYLYDDVGRVVGVIDGNGASASYTYDAAGNLTAITRHSAGALAILAFTPQAGPIGATIAINGTGFSTTPSQNTTTFNGIGATVQSATSTQLVVTVPAGASTGAIAVTTPNGSAVSGSPFVVTATMGGPTITGLSPTLANPDDTVTISGANFDTVPIGNRVGLHAAAMPVTAATATALDVTVPHNAGSGRITVGTRSGTATSTADLFVPPEWYGVASVDPNAAVRMNIGDTRSIDTHNWGIALVIFDGVVGQHVGVSVAGASTLTKLWGADQEQLISTQTAYAPFFDTVLPRTATYTLTVQPDNSAATFSVAISNVPADVTGTITPDGTPVTVTNTAQGQNAQLTFADTTGARVSLVVTNQTMTFSKVRFLSPDGTLLSDWTTVSGSSGFIEPIALWQTGTHKLLFDPSGANVGSATLALYDVPADLSGTLTIGASPSTKTFGTPGQNGSWTFAGTANQQITVKVTSNTIASVLVNLRKPDGTSLTSTIVDNGTSFNLGTQTLPVTGTYSVVVDPRGANTGSLALQVTNP